MASEYTDDHTDATAGRYAERTKASRDRVPPRDPLALADDGFADSDSSPTRRTFLAGAGAAALAGLASACADQTPVAGQNPQPVVTATSDAATEVLPTPTAPSGTVEVPVAPSVTAIEPVAVRGSHQAGVLESPVAAGLVAAFDVIGDDRTELVDAIQDLDREIRRLMQGSPSVPDEGYKPPVDSGAVGADTSTAGIAITVGVGASLFDERFGLGDRRPAELIEMPRFFNDRLVRTDWSHGDLALVITGPSTQGVVFALHQAVRVTERRLRLRWVQEGYNDLLPPDPDRVAPTRNLMGFRDGSSNLDTANDAEMNEHVWVGLDDGEPEWATGGTYLAVRIIRMQIEFWATAALVRQEQIFGRHRDTGAPLGQSREDDEPAFADDPNDESVPPRSHMRLANPRTPNTGRILRRGFSYLNGVDPTDATMDQGLLFLAYQRSLSRGFLAAQSRLDGEPLEDYVKPVGGGLFFVLPGSGDDPDGWLGQSLFA